MKNKKHRHNLWFWLQIIFIALTPLIFRLAYIERGFFAIGGEFLFPLFPLAIWAFVSTVKYTPSPKGLGCNGEWRIEKNGNKHK